MAETVYTYSLTDTANNKVDGGKLRSEIQAVSTITVSLNRIDTDIDEIFCVFNDVLPTDSLDDQVTILTGIINAHQGIPDVLVQPVRIQETNVSSRQLVVKGLRFVANLDSDTQYDIDFDEVRELQGVEVFIERHTSGDWIELYAVHPFYGPIAQFGETVYIPPSGVIEEPPSFDTTTVPVGLIIRFKYHSVATSGDQPIIICHLRLHR